jgi:hypothetical protein
MRLRLIALAAALVALVGVAGGSAATKPTLRLLDEDQITFRGAGFKVHEHVHVLLYAGTRSSKWTTAGMRGGFVVAFRGYDANACTGFGATAVGNKGSRATFKRAPGVCPAP